MRRGLTQRTVAGEHRGGRGGARQLRGPRSSPSEPAGRGTPGQPGRERPGHVERARGIRAGPGDRGAGLPATGQPVQLEPYQAALAATRARPGSSTSSPPGPRACTRRVTSISGAIAAYVRRWTTPIIRMSRSNLAAARRTADPARPSSRWSRIRRQFGALDRPAAGAGRAAPRRGGPQRRGGAGVRPGRPGAAALLLVGGGDRPAPDGGAPGEAAGRARRPAARGDLSARVPERGAAELGELAVGFNAMARGTRGGPGRGGAAERRAPGPAGRAARRCWPRWSGRRRKPRRCTTSATQLAAQTQIEGVAKVTLREIADYAQAQVGARVRAQRAGRGNHLPGLRGAPGPGTSCRSCPPGEGLAGRAVGGAAADHGRRPRKHPCASPGWSATGRSSTRSTCRCCTGAGSSACSAWAGLGRRGVHPGRGRRAR